MGGAAEREQARVDGGRLHEREAEVATLRAALDGLSAGGGRAIAVEGPAGIGKSRLLDVAASADGGGVQVLRARGAELERGFAHGIAIQLFERRLAGARKGSRLLSGAAAHARGPLGLQDGSGAGTPQAELHGLFWLVVNLAAERPLVLTVDDVHWADDRSLRWLHYLAGRLDGIPALLVLATRPADRPLVAELLAHSAVTVLRPAPLSPNATATMAAEALGEAADPAFANACHRASGGNPFLLSELLGALADEDARPDVAGAARAAQMRPPAVARWVLVRLGRLPTAGAALVRAVAVLGEPADLDVAAELAGLSEGEAAAAADAAAAEGILRFGRPLQFVHPLVGDAVAGEITTAERVAGHARAARLLDDRGAGDERVVLHLVAGEPAGDRWAVRRLRAAAREAMRRGAPEVAARLLRRALREPPPQEDRGALEAELGMAAARAGEPDGAHYLRAAMQTERDPRRGAFLALELSRALALAGESTRTRVAPLITAAERLQPDADPLAWRVEAELVGALRYDPETAELACERLVRLRGQLGSEHPEERLVLSHLALESALQGDSPASETVALATRALDGGQLIAAETADSPACYLAIHALVCADALDAADEALAAALDDARRRGSALGFASAAMCRTHAQLVRGEVSEAVADGQASLELARQNGWGAMLPFIAGYLVHALIEHDDLDEAGAILGDPGVAAWLSRPAAHDPLTHAQGRWHAARGDHERAAAQLLACGEVRRRGRVFNPAFSAWRSDAALSLAATGAVDAAHALADEELALARRYGAPRAVGAALRARGLIEPGDGGLALLGEAVDVLAGSPARLEYARALVDHGAALRRAGRRRLAREQLNAGLDEARRRGALALARRAHAELEASGLRPRKMLVGGLEALTPAERRVAELAAAGRSNAQIAQDLFVTPKTVETHLGRVYRKLGIEGRSGLAEALRAADDE